MPCSLSKLSKRASTGNRAPRAIVVSPVKLVIKIDKENQEVGPVHLN